MVSQYQVFRFRFTPANPELAQTVWELLESVDGIFNDYREDSEIGTINKGLKKKYTLSPLLLEAFQTSYQLNAVTNGNFDITVRPIRHLWKMAAKSGVYPDKDSITKACSLVGPQHFWLNKNTLSIHRAGVSFDFGGMVKGLIVDHALERLQKSGAQAALVQVGGETGCFGMNPHGRLHRLGIPNPLDLTKFQTVIADKGTGLSACTSGNYRLPIVINGKSYYHIFNPKNAQPSNVHTLSVSVLFAQTGKNALADGLSTAGVVMGPQKFIPLVQALGAEALVLTKESDGSIKEHKSEHWDRFVIKAD